MIFYKTEQKGLLFETFREISTFFAKMQKNSYTIYTNQNHKYHAENLIFYSIEQKGLFTDPGRRADSPQSTPMGSRCLLFLLSVNACGSSQGESRRNVISNPKKAKFARINYAGGPTKEKQVKEWYKNHPGGSVSACARDLDISRPTARKWKPEQAEPTKKPGKLSRILNILKE